MGRTHALPKKQTPFNVFIDDNRGIVGYGLTYGENSYNGRPTSHGEILGEVKIHAQKKGVWSNLETIKVPTQIECLRDPFTGKFVMKKLIIEGFTCPACEHVGHDFVIGTAAPGQGSISFGSTGKRIPIYVAPKSATKDSAGYPKELHLSYKATPRKKHKRAK